MKHSESTAATKGAMVDALKKELNTKPFDKISVSTIINDCHINRKTFYYHFNDIYDLLCWMLERDALDVIRQYDYTTDIRGAIEFVLDYIDDNAVILNNAIKSVGRDELKRFFGDDFFAIAEKYFCEMEKKYGVTLNPEYKYFLIHFYIEAIVGLITERLEMHNQKNREAIIDYIITTIDKSIIGIMSDYR